MWFKLLSPLMILASTSGQPKNCHNCKHPEPPPATVEKQDWKSGFELVAGFRWDRELECPTSTCPQLTRQVDPFFLGLQERLPLNEYFTLQARVDRDIWHEGEFQEAPHWNGAVSLNWAPWR